jgi:hypothetical protein
MKKILIEHIYHCTPETYWDKLWNADIRSERERRGCGALDFTVTQSRWEGDRYHQVVVMVEKVDAPAAVRKIFGETSSIEETSRWLKGSDTVHLTYKPSILSDKVSMVGTLTCSPAGSGHCRIVMDVTITAQVFLVGGIIEGIISKALPKRQAKDVAYFNAHQAD